MVGESWCEQLCAWATAEKDPSGMQCHAFASLQVQGDADTVKQWQGNVGFSHYSTKDNAPLAKGAKRRCPYCRILSTNKEGPHTLLIPNKWELPKVHGCA